LIPEEITYLTQCIQAASWCTDGFNSIAEVHAQEIYSFKDILGLMKLWNVFTLKSACVDLIRNAHLDVHSKVSSAGEELLNELIQIIIWDLTFFLEIKQGNHSLWFKTSSPDNPDIDISINFSYWDQFVEMRILDEYYKYIFHHVIPFI